MKKLTCYLGLHRWGKWVAISYDVDDGRGFMKYCVDCWKNRLNWVQEPKELHPALLPLSDKETIESYYLRQQ